MRDVIVVGAGGGGPVVAAELAARGLDVLLLEGGSSHAQPEREWTHFENDAFNPKDGYFRVGPADRDRPAWIRDQPQNSYIWNVTGVGGTTLHYYGNSPRAYRGAFAGYDGADRDAYDTDHLFPFPYEELVPYYEWVEATLPVQTAPMGRKERVFFDGCEALGLPVQTTKDTHGVAFRPQENAILQPQGTAGRTSDSSLLVYPQAQGCTFCGFCAQGCRSPLEAPRIMLGCGNFGGIGSSPAFFGAGETEAEAHAIMDAAWAVGITTFDTANVYGNGTSETVVGKLLQSRRDEVQIATKFGLVGAIGSAGTGNRRIDGRPEYAKQAIDESLARLGVDSVDLYYLHRVDPEVPIEETVGALAELVRAGEDIVLENASLGAHSCFRFEPFPDDRAPN